MFEDKSYNRSPRTPTPAKEAFLPDIPERKGVLRQSKDTSERRIRGLYPLIEADAPKAGS